MNDARAVLIAAATALELPLEATTCDRLLQYLALLHKWNKVYNLTSVRDAQQMLVRHVVDSLTVVPPLRRELSDLLGKTGGNPVRLLDVGSGAGLPGIVFALCCPELEISCIDAVAKKAAFVQQAAAELSLPNLRSVHGRVELLTLSESAAAYAVISARAFATLEKLVQRSAHLLAPAGVWLAMKGRAPQHEIESLPGSVRVFHVEPVHAPGLAEQRCIVWMRKNLS